MNKYESQRVSIREKLKINQRREKSEGLTCCHAIDQKCNKGVVRFVLFRLCKTCKSPTTLSDQSWFYQELQATLTSARRMVS